MDVDYQFDEYHRIAGLALSVELVAITIIDDQLQVLMVERDRRPFAGRFVLPGTFMRDDVSLDDTACYLRDRLGLAGISGVVLEGLPVASAPERDPRGRMVSAPYLAVVETELLQKVAAYGAGFSLLEIERDELGRLSLAYDGLPIEPGFDHSQIVASAVCYMRQMIDNSLIAFRFLPHYFTLHDLQRVHETILRRPLNKPLFRKRMLKRIFEDGTQLVPSPYIDDNFGRPARVYERARVEPRKESSPRRRALSLA